ncbi:MAG: hypothetical protein JSW52_01750, partial [Candidatus Coatesbacteria bacterium]
MLKTYNPNAGIRRASAAPVLIVSVVPIADAAGAAAGFGRVFEWESWLVGALWLVAAAWWYFNWRTFPVFYADGALRVFYRRFVSRSPLDPGRVVSIEPTAGPVNLFLRPRGCRIRFAVDDEREFSIYSFTDDKALVDVLSAAFPGRTKPRHPRS